MNFKEWLKLFETGTSTGAIAGFARPVFSSPIRRCPKCANLSEPCKKCQKQS